MADRPELRPDTPRIARHGRPRLGPAAALAVVLLAGGASGEWADWGLDAELGARFDSNLNRASVGSEEDWDVWFRPALRIGRVYQLADRTRVSGSAELAGEIFSRFDALDTVDGAAEIALLHKFGLGPAPWARIFARGGYREVQDAPRSGPQLEVGATLGRRFSPRLDARLGYAFTSRWGGDGPAVAPFPDDVFDQQVHVIALDGSFQLLEGTLLHLGFAYRRGDFDSNARSNRVQVLAQNDVEAVALDQVFGGWVYRVLGNAWSPQVGLDHALGRRWSVDLGYRFQYGEGGGLEYSNHVVRGAARFRY